MGHLLRCGQGVGKEAQRIAQNSQAEGLRVTDPGKKGLCGEGPLPGAMTSGKQPVESTFTGKKSRD